MQFDPRQPEFISTVEPFKIFSDRHWAEKPISDISTLKPRPDRDVLLIAGDGWNVTEDLALFLCFDVPADLMCINFSPKIIPKNWPINHFIAGDSHTPEMQRMAESLPETTHRHCWNRNSKGFTVRWSRNTSKPWNGTTANLGIKIGIALGYLKIVLAGCPMDNKGNWYTPYLPENDIKREKDHTAHLWKWTEIASRPIGRFIRSMSGQTAELFGMPTKDWLEDV